MLKPSNYHSHCSFCDGHAPAEDFIQEAIREGFAAYGFSSHAPLPFEARWTLKKEEVEAYLTEIQRLKIKYASQIEILVGLEIDYLTDEYHPMIPYFQQLPLDYRIGSVHLLEDAFGELVDLDVRPTIFRQIIKDHFNNDLEYVVRQYYAKQMRMVEKGGFNIVGHADKISRNANYCQPGLTDQPWYKHLIEEFFTGIAEKHYVVEINTKAFEESGYLYPNSVHFPLLRDLNIPVQVNSDAHYPERINSGRLAALQALKEAGIKQVCELHLSKWEKMML